MSDKTNAGRLALITGGSSGMGLEYARQLSLKGFDLVLVSNQEKELDAAGEALRAESGVSVTTRFQNLAASDAAENLHDFCKAEGLMPDILVCNAGMFFFSELTPGVCGKAETMVNLHVLTNTKLATIFGEDMKRRRHGRIILMSSMAARLPAPGISVYSASKAYLKSFGKSLWFEMHPYGVGVTTVCPAAIATSLYKLKPSLMALGVRIGAIHTPRWLVRRALKASERGRKTVSPSLMNLYLPPLLRLLPAPIENMLWKRFR